MAQFLWTRRNEKHICVYPGCPRGISNYYPGCNICIFATQCGVQLMHCWCCSSCHLLSTSAALRATFTRRPLLGYRCVLGNQTHQTTLLNIARAQCVWRCLSSNNCKVVSFNHRLNNCELSVQLCDMVASAADFSINVYGMKRILCSHWVPKSDYDAAKSVLIPHASTGNEKKYSSCQKKVWVLACILENTDVLMDLVL